MSTGCRRLRGAHHRWVVLALAGLTATLILAMPSMAMPVLFAEIAEDLGLSPVQIGGIWGTASLAGLLTGLIGRTIGDRFGTRRRLTPGCLVLGVTGAVRGLSTSFTTLTGSVCLSGLVAATLPTNLHKACAVRFSGKRLGLANSVVTAGMALGFMIGSTISATVLSPWLGGWRHALFFYGGVAVALGGPWALNRDAPGESDELSRQRGTASMRWTLSQVARLRNVWLLGVILLCVGGGCIQGMLGYLPLYLREIG